MEDGRICCMFGIFDLSSGLDCFSLSLRPSDGQTDVALHLSVRGEAPPRDDRAGREGVRPPPQHLLLQQDRHGRQSE